MTPFAVLAIILLSLVTEHCSAHTIRKYRKTVVTDNNDIFSSHIATALPTSAKGKKTNELKCVVKHKKQPTTKIRTLYPTISPAPTPSTYAPSSKSSKGGKGAKGEYCPTIISACSLWETEQAEFGSFQFVLDLKLAIEEPIVDVMSKLQEYLVEELNEELAACDEFDVRRRIQENAIMKLDLNVTQDTTTPCVEATTTGTCVNVDVNMRVTHDEGNANVIRTSIFQAVQARCDDIKDIQGIVDTFDPCPYLSITGGDDGNTGGDSTTGGGDGTDGSGGVTTGGSGNGDGENSSGGGDPTGGSGSGNGENSGGGGGDSTGGSGTENGENSGGGVGDSTGGSGTENGENSGGSGGDTTGDSGTGEGENSGGSGGDAVDSDDGNGSSTGSGIDGDGSSNDGGDSGTDGSEEDGGGGGVAAIGTNRESEEGVQTGGYISISVAAALLLLMLLFVVRRRHDYDSAMKHKHFIDEFEEDETETYLKDSDADSHDQQDRQVHVVGEADSVFSGWSGFTGDRRRDNEGLYPDQYGGSLDDSFLNQDVHKCSSATCELCEQKRRAGIQFVPAKMPGHSSYMSTDYPRHYMMGDTVNL